ncbi:DUF2085 domain-containing protein [Proteinivorax tanatarense]|uniref:DUF2085 domain-containing protein n=1 Tax=Proteinivorax tanatarense TaxID=1260629 RepID=UPI0033130B09
MEDIMSIIADFFCHRASSRSLFWTSNQFWLCSRCTGMYSGIFFSYLLFSIYFYNQRPTPTLSQKFVFIFFFLSMIFDGVLSYLNITESSNLLRTLTGAMFGTTIPVFFYNAYNFNLQSKKISLVIFCIYLLLTLSLIIILYKTIIPYSMATITTFTGIAFIYLMGCKLIYKGILLNK